MNSDDAGGSKGAATTQANPKTTELLDKNLDGINKKTGKTITNIATIRTTITKPTTTNH